MGRNLQLTEEFDSATAKTNKRGITVGRKTLIEPVIRRSIHR